MCTVNVWVNGFSEVLFAIFGRDEADESAPGLSFSQLLHCSLTSQINDGDSLQAWFLVKRPDSMS